MPMICPHCRKLMSEQAICPYCGQIAMPERFTMHERYERNPELQQTVRLALRYSIVLTLVLMVAGVSCSVLLTILVP